MNFYIPAEFYVAAPYVLAVALGLGLPAAIAAQYGLARRVPGEWRLIVALCVVGMGAMLSVALTSRTLDEAELLKAPLPSYEDFSEGFAASRWVSLALLIAAFAEAVRGWVRARQQVRPDAARPLLVALILFFGGTIVIQALASEQTGFTYKSLYVPLLLIAVYYQRLVDLRPVLAAAKWVAFLLCMASLALAVWRPDFVLHRPSPGVLPGIDWRLFGLTQHANTLGPIALVAIVLELHTPSRLSIVRAMHLLVASAVLVLSQSKTAWGAAIVMMLVVYVPLALNARTASASFGRAVWTIVACIVVLIALGAAAAVSGFFDALRRGVDIDTLTGRTEIWDITLRAWRDNVLFGYGPDIWGWRRRVQFRMFHVGQAHNQVVQTLGEAGVAGLLLLLGYLGTLLVVGIRTFVESRGLVLALLILVLTRCITEAPMRTDGLLAWSTFVQMLIVASAAFYARQAQTSNEPAQARARGNAPWAHTQPFPRAGVQPT